MAAKAFGQEPVLVNLITHFNARPDVLTAIVKQRKLIDGHLGYLHIARIDASKSKLLLLYHPPPSHDEKELWIDIEPRTTDPEAIKAQLHAWRAEAKRHYEIPEYPKIDYYSPPALFPFTVPIVLALSVLFFAVLGEGKYAEWFRATIAQYGGVGLLPAAKYFAGFMHIVAEPLWMAVLLWQHSVPFVTSLQWLFTVVALGYPGLNEWSECVEYERLRHVYKQTDVGLLPPRIPSSSRVKTE